MKEILYILLDNYAEHEIGFMPGAVSTDATGFRKEPKYINKMVAPTMGRIVTANGSGYLEFTRELLKLLENDTPEMINGWYTFMSVGLAKLYSPRPRFKFNTIGLFTSNNKATVDFYTKNFGFTTDWDGIQPNVEMMLGDMRIILYPRSDFEQMVSYKFQYPMGFNGSVELAFDVPSYADVDKEYQHALYHGAIPVLPPTTEPWGQRTCYVADPDGNLIEIGSFSK